MGPAAPSSWLLSSSSRYRDRLAVRQTDALGPLGSAPNLRSGAARKCTKLRRCWSLTRGHGGAVLFFAFFAAAAPAALTCLRRGAAPPVSARESAAAAGLAAATVAAAAAPVAPPPAAACVVAVAATSAVPWRGGLSPPRGVLAPSSSSPSLSVPERLSTRLSLSRLRLRCRSGASCRRAPRPLCRRRTGGAVRGARNRAALRSRAGVAHPPARIHPGIA